MTVHSLRLIIALNINQIYFSYISKDMEIEFLIASCNLLSTDTQRNKKKFRHFILRWYGTPFNIFKDDRIIKINYNHGFKNFKIYHICPKNPFIKFHKRDKK